MSPRTSAIMEAHEQQRNRRIAAPSRPPKNALHYLVHHITAHLSKMPKHYRTQANLCGYSATRLIGATLKLLWILRGLSLRRISSILFLLAAFFTVSASALAAHGAKARVRPSSSATSVRSSHSQLRSSRSKQRRTAHSPKRARAGSRAAARRVRPAVLRRRARIQRPVERKTAAAQSTDQKPALEVASLQPLRRPMPPPLRGSYESLVRQNEKTQADGLERIEDDNDLRDRIARGMLVSVPVSAALAVNGNLPVNRRYCRPWTAVFLRDLARAHAAAFHRPLEVSSAVRTVAYQKQLEKTNGNATSAEGDIASPHLTGATIDIAKKGLSRQQIGWMRAWLLPLEEAGKIDVEEEFRQACFHITVYKCYAQPAPSRGKAMQTAAAPEATDKSGF